MRVEVQRLGDLSQALVERWRYLQTLTPMFGTPLVGPDFALLIAKHRPGSYIAIGYQGDLAVAFFAFHKASGGYARAIGAPYCDYQGIVTDPDVAVNGDTFLADAGITSLAFTSLMDPHNIFETTNWDDVEGYRIDCSDGGEKHLESLLTRNHKWAKNLRRLTNKMNRELGEVRVVGHDTNPAAFEALKAIKIAQFTETGLTNVLGPNWVQGFMQELFEQQGGAFGGCLISLYAGDKFVAGQFGVRLGDWFHPWIASTCPLSHPYSPGIIFLSEMLRHSDEFGLKTIDLSEGHSHYKSQFCRAPTTVKAGIAGIFPGKAPASANGAVGLIKRRLDLIAALEPSFLGKVQSIGTTIAGIPARLKARQAQNDRSKTVTDTG